jgi:hypothetical protein
MDTDIVITLIFIALDDVIRGLLEPDSVLIRESDLQAGSILADMYKHICINNPPIEKSSFINAEIAKNNYQLVYHDEGYVCQYITFVRFAESVGVKAELPAIVHLINLS